MEALHILPERGHSIALRNNPKTTNKWVLPAEEWLSDIATLSAKQFKTAYY